MKNKNEPKHIDLTQEQAESLRQQLPETQLNQSGKDIVLGLLSFNFWLHGQLSAAKISIGF